MARKKATLVDDVLHACVPKKSQSFVSKLSAEDREEVFALRAQFQSGALGKSAYAVARALIAGVTKWAKDQGVTELASDALLDNEASHAMHKALGFCETERVVYFRKGLD